MQFTRMPYGARSMAIDRLNWTTAAFDSPVHDRSRAAAERGDRRGVDDRSAAVLRHVTGGALRAEHHAEQVDPHHLLEVGEVVVEDPA